MDLKSFKRWLKLISGLVLGQGTAQLLNLISGFLLLRWLSVEAYAQFSVAFGFQSMLSMLVDLGLSSSIIALVGDRGSDPQIVGSYIRSAKYFRNKLLIVVIPASIFAFFWITAKQNWNWKIQVLLLTSIISALFFQSWISYYSSPLLIHQQIRNYYKPQLISAGIRLFICYGLYISSALFSWTTAWINSAMLAFQGSFYRIASIPLIDEQECHNSKIDREMLNYISPLIPTVVFSAFQGQITVFITTIFGQTQNTAEMAALGRFGQIFLVLNAFNSVLISPYIAQVSHQNLGKRYFQILGGAIIISILISTTAFLFPKPLLWLLGNNYQHLKNEVGWSILIACLSYVGGVMWIMHMTRKWIHWWNSFFYVGLLLLTQVVCISYMDLSTTLNVLYFSFISNIAAMVIHIVIAIYGFICEQNRSEIF